MALSSHTIITVVYTTLDPTPCYEHDTRLGVVHRIASVLFGGTSELRQSDHQKIIPLILQIAVKSLDALRHIPQQIGM